MKKFGFIGCGNMGSAFVGGITSKGGISFSNIFIYTLDKDRIKNFVEQGAVLCENMESLANECDVIFLCIKPQQSDEVLTSLAKALKRPVLLITMLAGRRIEYFKAYLGDNARIIRIMPNTPLLLGCGAVALSADGTVTENELNETFRLISTLGTVRIIPENQMDTIVAVNGSSPAYFYLFADIMAEWAKSRGVDEKTALDLAVASMYGSAEMLLKSGNTPDELIKAVSSPGGTTLAALSSFDKDDIKSVFFRAMDACEKRSDELSSL